jgi:large subunit ribosomal protein L29e
MAKSKNHTAHNQSYKAHKNGIKKPKKHKYTSRKGVYHLSLHEIRFAKQLVAQNLIRMYV